MINFLFGLGIGLVVWFIQLLTYIISREHFESMERHYKSNIDFWKNLSDKYYSQLSKKRKRNI